MPTYGNPLEQLAAKVGETLRDRKWLLVTAESCTGGWVSEAVTSIAGSSAWFDRGFVSYSNQAKQDMLGVKPSTLTQYGAVSEQAAIEMAIGALEHSSAQIAVAVTGIAGPEGGSVEKPVGTVWIAWAGEDFLVKTHGYHFQGDRYSVRLQSTQNALEGLLDLCAPRQL